jgi:quinol monooxygenase YgiN
MPPLPWHKSETIGPAATYVLTMTRLPLRSYLRIPRILRATLRIMRALRSSDGLVGYSLKADLLRKTFWTASAWRDDEAVAQFVRSDAHRAAMVGLQPHMALPRIETVTVSGSELPPKWSEILHHLGTAAVTP